MSSPSRAEKSGFAAEAQAKIHGKFDPKLASEVLAWLNEVSDQNISTEGSIDNFHSVLKDGVVLCNLANSLKPGSITKISQTSMAFKQMENINNFLSFAASVGIPKNELFQTVDLYEKQDPNSVLICLFSLARKGAKFGKATLGPKESEGEKRTWSPEQLRAGENVIGLQAGSNKGATQSGQNFGNTRHI